ncbi:MAG: FAD-binding protein [Winogradskyella sp.]|uniref:FAD-binding and (Fe-S)-binding domain-containing protein n=1 Tax=Winogradskyella sp. TaxID=1883156 RepID=UPI0017D0E8B2|nr:FAD-binding protein [Winogradskyella sp.]
MSVVHLNDLKALNIKLQGELYFDDLMRKLYATDASVYRKLPLAVAIPKSNADIQSIIEFATAHHTSIIPRTAGTSLAGQCVGDGIVVDVSKYFTKILDLNEKERTVTVQPGVIRDQLNHYLKPYGLFFGPNTSTSNRCMIGGMVGNNSSGSTSIKYGVTRDKVIKLKTILSDGSSCNFKSLTNEEFQEKLKLTTREGEIYNTLYKELNSEQVLHEIKAHFPNPQIHRRNTGYAIDELIKSDVFKESTQAFNMCKLLAGSEGTLAFTTEITLKLDVIPPVHNIMLVAHYSSIEKCLAAVSLVMQHDLYSCEMLDKTILDLTKHNRSQQENRAFIIDDPAAILMCELRGHTHDEVLRQAEILQNSLKNSGLSFANEILHDKEIDKAIELRKAGLGLLGNMVGDNKAVACIEDTAVALEHLEPYISEFTELMNSYQQKAVYYAHAGAGELHLRPILNLKLGTDVDLFRAITTDVAKLVKKYNGSMSGEHGDGIVRSEFIALMIGAKNYQILERIKRVFDPQNIFNPGKIIAAHPMDKNLRYEIDRTEPKIETLLDFSRSAGILREAEKCNGSGDCRKLPEFGGTMCPSYRATRNEKDSTRARANALREYLTQSEKANRFNHKALKSVFDLCLSCKACVSECPSSVDVASLKAEFQYQYQKANGFKFKDTFFANATKYNKRASAFPSLFNGLMKTKFVSGYMKLVLGIHPKRTLPKYTLSVSKLKKFKTTAQHKNPLKTVYLFVDEFTNYLESSIAYDAKYLLETLNYKVVAISHLESGRSHISKGFLDEAKELANNNVKYLKHKINSENAFIGIEPSAILSFKDEYVRLADDKNAAEQIAQHTFLIEEFIQQEIEIGNISSRQFTIAEKRIKFHGHCHQKALSNQKSSFDVLNLPTNFNVTIIPSGCCGMAGSFGYEKQHYDISMQIGEQTLFPAVRKATINTIIAANGTSCRHQIKDGTGRIAKHPITILKEALL